MVLIEIRGLPERKAGKGRRKNEEREKILSEKISESASKKKVQTATSSNGRLAKREIEEHREAQNQYEVPLHSFMFLLGKNSFFFRKSFHLKHSCFSETERDFC